MNDMTLREAVFGFFPDTAEDFKLGTEKYQKAIEIFNQVLSIFNKDFEYDIDCLYFTFPSPVNKTVSVHYWKNGHGSKILNFPCEILDEPDYIAAAKKLHFKNESTRLIKEINRLNEELDELYSKHEKN